MKALSFFLLGALLASSGLQGTIGYRLPGYGTKSLGMGGATAAYPIDAIAPAINPAGIAFLEDRIDVGLQLFSPVRSYSHTGFGGDKLKSRRELFPIPHFGLKRRISRRAAAGFALHGNGGLNTYYDRSNPVFGSGKLGVDYAQVIFAPTLSFLLSPDHALGISPLIGFQRIKIYGLQNFSASSASPSHVSNRDYDYALGGGLRIGWLGRLSKRISLGASYSTRVYMSRFSKYRGLLADRGRFDVPPLLVIGLRCQATPHINATFDFQKNFYSQVRAISHSIDRLFSGELLGTKEGPGFGWKDLKSYHLGLEYKGCRRLETRLGYAYAPIVYGPGEVDANIVAPAVTSHNLTAGLTYRITPGSEINLAYFHAFHNRRKGSSKFGLGTVYERMHQNALEISLGFLI